MTDTIEKDVVEIEANPPKAAPEAQPQSQPFPEDEEKPKGAGFIWLLALLLVLAYGGYAAWPYMGEDVHKTAAPYIEKAKSYLDLDRRPTQPSLNSEPVRTVERPAQAQKQPAPVYPPEGLAAEPPAPTPMPRPPVVRAEQAPAPAAEDTQALKQRLAVLENQIQAPAPAQSGGEDIQPMMQSLTERLSILENQLTAQAQAEGEGTQLSTEATAHISGLIADLHADMATLKTRVASVETAPRAIDPSASSQALILSVTQLDGAIERAGPYVQQLMALERIGGADPVVAAAVSRLRVFAENGVPTQVALIDAFKPMSVAVMKAHNTQARDGWLDEVTGTLANLVVVRQTDPSRIDDPVERALAIAELAMSKRDVPTAVGALSALPSAEAQAANSWLQAASARIEALDALNVLHNHALAALAATGSR